MTMLISTLQRFTSTLILINSASAFLVANGGACRYNAKFASTLSRHIVPCTTRSITPWSQFKSQRWHLLLQSGYYSSMPTRSALTATVRMMATSRDNANLSYEVGFMFPGQGAQSVGMGAALCSELPAARALFDRASDILGYDLLGKCTAGPKEDLDSTVVSQPAIFVASMAALERLRAEDPAAVGACSVAMGLSLGEYSALCFAGAFSFEDGVRLTQARGEAMQRAADTEGAQSGMVAVIGLDAAAVEGICKEAAQRTGELIGIANYLASGNYAVSGSRAACEAVREIAPAHGARMAVPLAVAGAFHTQYMQPAVEHLRSALAQVDIQRPRLPVVSNVDARPHWEAEDIRAILALQVTSPVRWEETISAMVSAPEFQKCYEVGPGNVCRGIVKRFSKKLPVFSVQA